MRLPTRSRPLPELVVLLSLALGGAAGADPVRLLSADDRGVTLRLEVPAYQLGPPGGEGRAACTAPGLALLDQPGRPQLPFASVLIALPPGARAQATVVGAGAEEVREGVRIALGERSAFRDDPGRLGLYPISEPVPPILDGVWPVGDVAVGEPFVLRRQRMLALRILPFHHDEANGRLTLRRNLTVRVDFVGAALRGGLTPAPEDRYFEPVLRAALINYEQGRRWRAAAPAGGAEAGRPLLPRPAAATSALAFDEGQPEVRVKLDSTGVHALDYDLLAAHGYPSGVPIAEVSVHRHEFLESATPPYATIELPIELDDLNANGVFDSGDRIVLYVQDWAERSRASQPQRAWGNAEMVFVTRLPGGQGRRIGPRTGWRDLLGPTPLASYPYSQRFEKNFAGYIAFPVDTLVDPFDWTEVAAYYIRPDSVMFETNQLDTTHAVTIATRLQGRKGGNVYHVNWGLVGNRLGQFTTLFDSTQAFWTGKQAATFSATVTGSAVSEGRTNRIRLLGKTSPSDPDPATNSFANTGINYLDVTYWRAFHPLGGYLLCNSADATSAFELLAPGFTDSVALRGYDVTDPLDPRRLSGIRIERNGPSFDLRFQDSTVVGVVRKYVLFDTPKTPPPDHYLTVVRRTLTGRPADYLLIVPEAFLGAVQPLVDLRQSQGLQVLVAPLESVNDEFNGGRHSAHAVRRFIRYAYNQWNTRFVLLLGDGAGEDPQNFLGSSGPDWIPTQMINEPVAVFTGSEIALEAVPSDPWYVWCADPVTCPDPSLAPRLPDLFLGRLPVNSLQEASDAVAKIVAYENVSPAETWRRQILLGADDEYSGDNTFGGSATLGYCQRDYEARFRQLNEKIRSVILDEAGLKRSDVEVFDLGYYLRNEPVVVTPCTPPCEPDTCRPDRAATGLRTRATYTPDLFNRLNAGRLWWNYQGHANEEVLSHESFYLNTSSTDDALNYLNDGRPFLFSAFSCHVNNFGRRWERSTTTVTRGPSLGEKMVNRASRGAVASWASVGYEVVPTNGVSHINVELARALFSTPPHDPYLGDQGARVVLGEAIATALLRWHAMVLFDASQRDVGITYTLLGDPATRLSIGAPQALVTANRDTVTDGQPFRLHTPGDTLRLDADLVSNVALDTLWLEGSINSGPATVIPPGRYTLSPPFPDTAASGGGGRRYHLAFRDTLGPCSYRYTFNTVDHYGLPTRFDALFPFQTVLRAEGIPINDGDAVPPNANLSMLVLSPAPIDPKTDLALTVNGQPQPFDTAAVAGEASRREWVLSWTHPPYPIDQYDVRVASSCISASHQFKVDVASSGFSLRNALAFPNPFDDDLGTYFSFSLVSGAPADVQIRVYTVSGRLLLTRTERGLLPGYHQIAWDGRDAEGDKLANGIYIYRMLASNGSQSTTHEGRLVKLRKPRRVDNATP